MSQPDLKHTKMKKSELRQIIKEEISKVVNENIFEKEYEYLKITPEDFKVGDLFLYTPSDDGEFFNHKDSSKILSITQPKDGRSNTTIVNTKERGNLKLSATSLYNIARKK